MIILTIKAARVNCNLTLVEAAAELDVNKDSLSRYERDSSRISLALCKKMAELYQIPMDQLYFGHVDDFPLTKHVKKRKRK